MCVSTIMRLEIFMFLSVQNTLSFPELRLTRASDEQLLASGNAAYIQAKLA